MQSAELRFLQKGYTATSVDEICGGAGATKGAFFHHFRSKEQVGLIVLETHALRRQQTIRQGAQTDVEDPVRRAFDYVDYVTEHLLDSKEPMCLIAALTIELAEVNDRFRAVCSQLLGTWLEELTAIFGAALDARGLASNGTSAETLASQFLASYHGGLLMNRAMRNPSCITESMHAFRRHLELELN